jgi:mRNA-degrading endonuclease RelE of RelBE toxin-antitoxin system
MALLVPPAVLKQLAAVPKADARRLLERLRRIADAPNERLAGVSSLAGMEGSYRVRQGDWQAVFSIDNGDVVVNRVAHRRKVYR